MVLGGLRRVSLVAILSVLAACSGGGEGGAPNDGDVNRAPRATLVASGDARASATGVNVTVGGLVYLDGSSSTDDDHDTLAYEWVLLNKPAGSSTQLPQVTAQAFEWRPDVMGAYTLQLKVRDPKGASGLQQLVVTVDNRAPASSLVVTPQFTPIPATLPVQSVSTGANVLLDATASTDPDGDPLSISFELVERPVGSTAALNVVGKTARLVPDALGLFKVRVRGADGRGASFESNYTFDADNRAPNPVVVGGMTLVVPTILPIQTASIGGDVLLDATSSTDPDGDALAIDFELFERPAGSAASLTVAGRTAHLVPDALGLFKVRVRGADGRGGSFESIYTFDADNRAPSPVVVTAVTPVVANAGASVLQTSVGYDVVLSGVGTSDPDGDAITQDWIMTSKPLGSVASLSAVAGTLSGFTPDLMGDYVVTLTATDAKGAKSVYTTTIQVNNRRPMANIGSNATPQSLPGVPSVRVPLGTEVTFRGSVSSDADGDPLTYAWSIDARPTGSTAALSSASVADPAFIADREGMYVFRLRVTDSAGAYSERTASLDVGTHVPVAVVNRNQISLLVSTVARASAALSFDDDGDALTYQWTLDAKPAGSTATIANPNTSELAFTPDVPGIYVAAVTVRDARSASIAYVTVRALGEFVSNVSLGFVPDDARYSTGLDKVIAVATNPDTVHVIDPFTSSVRAAVLPAPVKNFSLSPDGRLAVILHEGLFSLVDLETATVIRTTASGGAQTDAFVTNAGIVFLIGQTGGQWVNESVVVINGRTGVNIPQAGGYMGMFYGTQYGVFADRLNKVFLMEQGLSPSDIDYFSFDPSTHQVTRMGDSPYHGDYNMYVPLFLSANQDLIFTSAGNYFRTDTLAYAGSLLGAGGMHSFSHSASTEEALVLQWGPSSASSYPYPPTYSATYKRFHGSLMLPDGELSLPTLAGAQTYGIKIFHSASGGHVLLVQTGTNEIRGTGARYHVIVR